MGIRRGGVSDREIRGYQLLRMDIVGREKQVLRIAVGDLLRKGGRGAKRRNDLDTCSVFILSSKDWEHGLEIGRGGDV